MGPIPGAQWQQRLRTCPGSSSNSSSHEVMTRSTARGDAASDAGAGSIQVLALHMCHSCMMHMYWPFAWACMAPFTCQIVHSRAHQSQHPTSLNSLVGPRARERPCARPVGNSTLRRFFGPQPHPVTGSLSSILPNFRTPFPFIRIITGLSALWSQGWS